MDACPMLLDSAQELRKRQIALPAVIVPFSAHRRDDGEVRAGTIQLAITPRALYRAVRTLERKHVMAMVFPEALSL